MSTQNSGPLSIAFDTTSVKTGIPQIVDGHICKVAFGGVQEQTVDGKGKVLVFTHQLKETAPSDEGRGTVSPGFPLIQRVYLYGKDTQPGTFPERAIKQICAIQDAYLGTGDEGNKKGRPARPAFDTACVASMIGKEAFIKVKAKDDEYGGNEIAKIINPEDLKP